MPGNQYDTKVCKECNKTKHHTEFYCRSKTTGRRDTLCIPCRLKVIKDGYDPHKASNVWLKHKYGITTDDRKRLWEEQNGVCAICGKPGDGRWKQLCVDHCHKTGIVRNLLCRNCNMVIGQVDDNPELLMKMADYVTRWMGQSEQQELPE